jgi:hypothetical protein
MFKQFLHTIPGADWFMIGSLALFLVFFLMVGVYLLTVSRDKMDQMAAMPLDGSETEN